MRTRIAALTLLLLLSCSLAQAAPTVWVTHSLDRVMQTATPGAATTIALDAACGETESAQLVLRSSTGGIVPLKLLDAAGLTVTLFLEDYTYVKQGSSQNAWYKVHGGGPGWYPDGLIPLAWGSTVTLAANVNQPLWIDVLVPRGTTPGTRTVRILAGDTQICLPVTVHKATIPVKPALASSILFWNLRYNRQANELMLQHRLQPMFINSADTAALAAQGQDWVGVGFWADATTSKVTRALPTAAELKAATAKYPGTRWLAYVIDELGTPTTAVYNELAIWDKLMDAANVKFLATVPRDGGWNGIPRIGVTLPMQKSWVGVSGVEAWSYNCNTQWQYGPFWETDQHPNNYRAWGLLNAILGYKGTLYWAAEKWGATPWDTAESTSGDSYPGEGVLVHPATAALVPTTPAKAAAVLPSVRLKYLRDAADDYDLYALAVAAGKTTTARSYITPSVSSWTTWTKEPAKLIGIHTALLKLLDAS